MTHKELAERRRQMAAAVAGGKTPEKVAGEFGVARATVWMACREQSVDARPALARDTYGIIARLLNTSDTTAAIAADHGVSRQRVQQILQLCREAGIKFGLRRKNKSRN